MNLLLVDDDEKFTTELCRAIYTDDIDGCTPVKTASVPNVYKLAETLKPLIDDASVLLINVNLKVGKEPRQSHQGTDLLTWLRINGVMNHCLLYSFHSLESLVRVNPKNLLLLSQGTSFVHLPNSFVKAVRHQTNAKAETGNLKSSLKAIFNVGQFRHRDANWWSVKVLWDVHRVATGGQFNVEYPKHVQEQLSRLNNAVGAYLHGLEVTDVIKFIEEKKARLAELNASLSAYRKEIEQNIHNGGEEREVWVQLYAEYQEIIREGQQAQLYSEGVSYAESREELNALREQQAEVLLGLGEASRACEEKADELRRVINEIEETQQILSSFDASVKEDLFRSQKLETINSKSKILLIDDNAENGWEDVFRAMFKVDVKSVVPPKGYRNDIDGLYDFLKADLEEVNQSNTPYLIFLDLRLFNEKGRSIDVDNVSGKVLLSKIRANFRAIPIVITTASNKIWTFQKLIELGADAYWVKEGLDELRGVEDSVRNYTRLISLVARMTDGRYQLLKEISDYAERMERIYKEGTHWSTNVMWRNDETSIGDVGAVSRALNESVYVIKNYLHNYHLGYGHGDTRNESFILSGVINKMAGVYESIHNTPFYVDAGTLREERGDYNLEELRKIRNRFSHTRWTAARWSDLERCFKETKKYLDTPFV